MSGFEHANALLAMARKDLDALRGMVGNPLFADEIFGFHAQQAVEKSLKAWLAVRSLDFPLTHDISRLLSLLEDDGVNVGLFLPLVQFTVFAVQARYETGLMEADVPIDRKATIEEVDQLLTTVESLISPGRA
jgi:HEPN domain-containing protein